MKTGVYLKIQKLKLDLPTLSPSIGLYKPAIRSGNLVYTSGQLPLTEGRLNFKGRVGKEVSLEQGQRAAKLALVNCLAAVQSVLGDLNKVKQVVRMNAFICSAVDFNDQPKLANAASELLQQIFGETKGAHSRTAIGCLELPMGSPVEIDLIVEI